MTGGFTGAGAMPAVERPMLVSIPQQAKDAKKKKAIKEAAQRVVKRLLGES